jgi:electron transfer flavoprotein alpha subunit
MDIAVLVKAVPDLDRLRYDPKLRTVVREGSELFLNPFDLRALRVALDLRRAGESVTVVSLGPRAARDPLRDAPALGVDRTLLLSDPRFAGSDTLATARALAAVLRTLGHDLVLGGAWTTDSETGQVGPEVASLLGVPVLSGARSIVRDGEGNALQVTLDTLQGWARYRAAPPLLITVGEKISKPAKVAPDDRARVPDGAVEVLGLDGLALSPAHVGAEGSPTSVRWVTDDSPSRSPYVLRDGTPEERVTRAAEALRAILRDSAVAGVRPFENLTSLGEGHRVLVLVTDSSGRLEPSALALLSEVRRSLPGHWPSAVWVGGPPSVEESALVRAAGALDGDLVPVTPLPTDSRIVSAAFEGAMDRHPEAAAGIFLSDSFGREVAGQLAARRSLGLTGDAIGVRAEASGDLLWSKPSFGGRTLAGILSRTRPSLATVRPGVWDLGSTDASSGAWGWKALPAISDRTPLVPESVGTEVGPGTPSLEGRPVVVAVGMGVGGPSGVAALAPLLSRWDAALGATRRVVDAGWVPRRFQVGLTGRSPAPRLGVLLGVSGSPNHLVGWKRARALMAVNRDPEAPVFRDVDVGIVGTLEEIVPLLGDAIAPLLGR